MAVKQRKTKVDADGVHAHELVQLECCGIEELSFLSKDTNATLIKVCDDSFRRAIIIFHDAVGRGRGEKLMKKIRREKLGSVHSSKKVRNPNSGNIIQMWTWYPDWDALDKFVCNKLELINDNSYWYN